MDSKYGHFSQQGEKFIITTPDIPRNWYNYFYNDNYITFTSQTGTGEGFFQDSMGRRIKTVKNRAVYIADGESFRNINGLPVEDAGEEYECTHAIGYTVIHTLKNGIASDYGLFVPDEADKTVGGELAWVTVKNCGNTKRTVKIISYIYNELDGGYALQGYNTGKAEGLDREAGGLVYTKKFNYEGENTEGAMFHLTDGKITGYDRAQNAFIGPYGNTVTPKALLKNGGCTNSDCINEKMCYALETEAELAPGEEKRVLFLTGVVIGSREQMLEYAKRFLAPGGFENEFSKMQRKYSELLGGVKIKTPDEKMDKLVNNWLTYLSNMGSRWARVRHNGYRDMVSDTECLAAFNPELAWERVKRILTYQYSNGYAPRTFLEGAIKDNNFSDCTVWLTFAVYYIINELGDLSLLDEMVSFNDKTEASVYEHIRRSVDFLYNFKGEHGLIKIWGGDWNDCMNRAGLEHRGVSIWLTMAWYRACKMFVELAEKCGKTEDAELFRARGEEMRQLVDKYGWDDEGYYIYAINDYGEKIGASECDEGKIYLNPQIWAIFSGIGLNGKGEQAFEKADRELQTELGCVCLKPAYTYENRHIGSMTNKAPGVQENGSVYLHTVAWKIAADAILGRRDLVEKDIISMLPFRNPVVAGRGEPYMLFNSYCGIETGYRYGTPGQSWRTASGQWFLKSVINYVFGLMPTHEGLTVNPCLPESWDKCSITKQFRKAVYNIEYAAGEDKKIEVDGNKINGNLLPYADGKTFEVKVTF